MIGETHASVGNLHVFRSSLISTGSVENNVIHFNELPYPGTEARRLDFSSTISEPDIILWNLERIEEFVLYLSD